MIFKIARKICQSLKMFLKGTAFYKKCLECRDGKKHLAAN